MSAILAFRIFFLGGFIYSAWKWGDWGNWQKYYSSMLFVMVVNLTVGLLTYHHPLWIFGPDTLVTTETLVDLLNTYFVLPATALVYLSNFPAGGVARKYAYIAMWVLIYGTIESVDHILGGISYANGWSLSCSILFDCAMFPIILIHHVRPLLGWLISLIMALFIIIMFGFLSAEMK